MRSDSELQVQNYSVHINIEILSKTSNVLPGNTNHQVFRCD